MAEKTLYDILEVSRSATPTAIKSAYDRLSQRYDPERVENQDSANAKLLMAAVKDAFLTLGNPGKRLAYDNRLDSQYPVEKPFWTLPKVVLIAILFVGGGAMYSKNKAEQARIAAEQQIAVAKAKQAEEEAQAAAEAEKSRQAHLKAQAAAADARLLREREYSLRSFTQERMVQERQAKYHEDRERITNARSEMQRRHEENQAAAAAQAQLAREKQVLCQMERQRYGKAISCPY